MRLCQRHLGDAVHLLANTPEAAPYAFGFCIPVATSGLRFICRPSVVHLEAASAMDYPLSSRLDETDAMVVFDNVLVPWERVFIHRDAEMCNGLYNRTGAMPHVMHQFSTKNLAKAEFMMALGFAIAKSTNIDQHLHVQGMLAELIQFTEFCRACLRASEADAEAECAGRDDAGGDAAVDRADDVPENVRPRLRDHPDAGRRWAGRRCRPMPRPAARYGRTWRATSRRPMPTRAPGSSCSGWPSMPRCRRSPAGSSFMSATTPAIRCGSRACCIRCMIVNSYMQRIWDLLDDLEARQYAGPHGPGFRPKLAAG